MKQGAVEEFKKYSLLCQCSSSWNRTSVKRKKKAGGVQRDTHSMPLFEETKLDFLFSGED